MASNMLLTLTLITSGMLDTTAGLLILLVVLTLHPSVLIWTLRIWEEAAWRSSAETLPSTK